MATINIIGIPGAGKSETATMFAHLIHPRVAECIIKWAGSNELRHIKEYLAELPKGRNYIIIFDDTSNALDALSGEELSDAFLSYTKGRHHVLGKLCIFMIYHYSKSQKKNFRAMALFNIFLSATATEKGNIRELIRGDDVAVGRYKQFQRLFTDAFSNKTFTLHFGRGGVFPCKDSDPFRIAFVLGPMGADIRLTKIMKCQECAEKPATRFLPPEEILKTIESVYGLQGRMALSYICYTLGYKNGISERLRHSLNYVHEILAENATDREKLANLLTALRKTRKQRVNRSRIKENEGKKKLEEKVVYLDPKEVIETQPPVEETLEPEQDEPESTSLVKNEEPDEPEEDEQEDLIEAQAMDMLEEDNSIVEEP